SIDGEDIQTLEEVKIEVAKAELDKEFDEGSTMELANLNPEQIQDLELLGRVWGFLKYHHPAIAQGNYNWDYELFRFLPEYLNSENQKSNLIIKWIDSLGELDE